MVENQPRVATARLPIAKPILSRLSRTRIPFFSLGKVAANQSGFTERGELPVLVATRILNFFETCVPDVARDLTSPLLLSDEQLHRGGVDSRPITARQFYAPDTFRQHAAKAVRAPMPIQRPRRGLA